jgi:hypothetical protein
MITIVSEKKPEIEAPTDEQRAFAAQQQIRDVISRNGDRKKARKIAEKLIPGREGQWDALRQGGKQAQTLEQRRRRTRVIIGLSLMFLSLGGLLLPHYLPQVSMLVALAPFTIGIYYFTKGIE